MVARARVIPGHVLPEWQARVFSGRRPGALMSHREERFAWVTDPSDVLRLELLQRRVKIATDHADAWRPTPREKEAMSAEYEKFGEAFRAWLLGGGVGAPPKNPPLPAELKSRLRMQAKANDRLQAAFSRIGMKQAGCSPEVRSPSPPSFARGDKRPLPRVARALNQRWTDHDRLLAALLSDNPSRRRKIPAL